MPWSSGEASSLVIEDWLRQAQAWQTRQRGECSTPGHPVAARADAAGGCDGVKNGAYGFHTSHEPFPWWQVDLGEAVPLTRLVVFNRLDYPPGLHNADTLHVLTSLDGELWTLRHDQQGRHFGGMGDVPPLEIQFAPGTVTARFVRLQIPSPAPLFFHLDEVEIYGPASPTHNLALHQPALQSSVSPWSTAKPMPQAIVPRYPLAETLERSRRLSRELALLGVSTAAWELDLDTLEQRGRRLSDPPPPEAARALYLDLRRVQRRLVFAHPLLDFDRLLFIKRFTQETYPDICLNHMPWVSRPGGDICVLEPAAPAGALFGPLAAREMEDPPPAALQVRTILNGALGPGHVHGLDLGWDGDRVVFGYARARSTEPPEGWLDRTRSYALRLGEEPIHLFEVDLDGRRLRQLTHGGWSDLDPAYLPNGDIAFVSERCGTSLQCNEYDKDETSCNLYVMNADGGQIRRLSVNKDGDYLPRCLDNGLLAYTRWEYHERSWAYIQSLWFIRPDGTGADALYKQHFVDPWALEDVRSIPGSEKLVAIAAGHHTLAVGPIVVIHHALGINDPQGLQIVTPDVFPPEGGMAGTPVPEGGVVDCGGFYATPWALSEKLFLAAYTYGPERDPAGYALYLVDVFGNKELLYRDPAISCFLPMPLRARPRPPILTDLTDPKRDHATCLLTDAAFGLDGVDPAAVRYLRLAEPVGWPYDLTEGGHRYGEDHRYGGPEAPLRNLANWTPVRVLGDVPVEPDGSVHFRVPADTAVYFQLLDDQRRELRRMRSFISFQPGEVRACSGCHESRATAPASPSPSLAARRTPAIPEPPPWGDRPVSFLRDIQPLLDQHCVRCHRGLQPAGGLDFFGGLTSHDPDIPGYGYNRAYETLLARGLVALSKVREQDASITPPLAYGSLRSRLLAALDEKPHPAEVHLTPTEHRTLVTWMDANAPYHDRFVNKRSPRPAYDLAADPALAAQLVALHENRCRDCHPPKDVARVDWIHLGQPADSLFLRAPLARDAGGDGACPVPVYLDTHDADYQAVLALVRQAVERAWAHPRRDLQALLAPVAAAPASSLPSRSWTFDQPESPDPLGGWRPNADLTDVTVRHGHLECRAQGPDPILEFTGPLDLPVNPWQFLEVRLRADADGTAEWFWSGTRTGPFGGFSQEKSTRFNVRGDGQWRTLRVFPFWHREGRLARLRFDLYDGARFAIEGIRIGTLEVPPETPTPSFLFTNATAGWQPVGDLEASPTPSGLELRAAHPDAFLLAPPVRFAAEARSFVSVELAADQGHLATLLYATDAAAGLHRFPFPIQPGPEPVVYHLDLLAAPEWRGQIRALGLQPSDEPGASVRLTRVEVSTAPHGPARLQIRWFGTEEALPRTGRATRLTAILANTGPTRATAIKATLHPPPGSRLAASTSEPASATLTVAALDFGEQATLSWPLLLDHPGEAVVRLEVQSPHLPTVQAARTLHVTPPPPHAPAGYVPEPQPVRGPFEIGAYYFPGWRTAGQWQPLRDFPERRPVLGWYREGDPEVADWHIKWAVEHGLTFFAYDWYWSEGARQLEHALHEGYFQARYRHLLSFCLLWANHNAPGTHSLDDCLDVTRYWIAHYFHRPEYLKVAGQPVLILFSPQRLFEDLGSDGVRRAFEAMRETTRQAGFPGLCLLACVNDAGEARRVAAEGYDALTAYTWPGLGRTGESLFAPYATLLEGYRRQWEHLSRHSPLPLVLPLNGGWDSRPWHGVHHLVRHGRTPALFQQHLTDARRFLEARSASSPTRPLPPLAEGLQRLVLIEAWNEWGEGSYIEPHQEFGFGYLDALREVFTDAPRAHHDATPADLGLGPYDVPADPPHRTAWSFDTQDEGWGSGMNLTALRVADGLLHARTTGRDPAFFGPPLDVRAADFAELVLRLRLIPPDGQPFTDSAQLFWRTTRLPESEATSVRFPVAVDGAWHEYRVPLAANARWRGRLTRLRLDPVSRAGVEVSLDSLRLVPAADPP